MTHGKPSSSGPHTPFSSNNSGAASARVTTHRRKRISGVGSRIRSAANRSIVSTSHRRPASSWSVAPGGTVTQAAHAGAVSATGTRYPTSRAIAVASTSTPSARACRRE